MASNHFEKDDRNFFIISDQQKTIPAGAALFSWFWLNNERKKNNKKIKPKKGFIFRFWV
jgi:hypothetical protein